MRLDDAHTHRLVYPTKQPPSSLLLSSHYNHPLSSTFSATSFQVYRTEFPLS